MVDKEKKVEIVLWGLGTNGKNLIDVLNEGIVIAIIDTNAELLKLKYYQNIPIINFDTYLCSYREYYIVVTPMISNSIVKDLENNFITDYFMYKDCCAVLSAFLEVANNSFIDTYKLDKNINYFINGVDFFSLFLYINLINNKFSVKFFFTDDKQKLILDKFCKKKFINDYLNLSQISKTDHIIQMQENGNICNKYSEILDYGAINTKLNLKWKTDLQKFKNIHLGKRVFIIATGPSLKIDDLSMLKKNKEMTMSMNRIYHAFNNTSWRPDYYVVSDGGGIRDYEKLEEREELFANVHKFFSDNYLGFWNNHLDNSYHCFRQMQNKTQIKFSSDISEIVYSGLTVVYSCLQLAVYMGFREIFLLGCDFSFSPGFDSDEDHFYDASKSVSKGMYTFNYDFVQKAYETAKDYSELHGINICNATRGGKLEVFKRVNFDDLF